MVFLEQPQIVVGGVKNQFAADQCVKKWRNVHFCQRIYEAVARSGADLNETNFFRIGVQTVRLGINGEPRGGLHDGQKFGELGLGINHGWTVCRRFTRLKRIPARPKFVFPT